MNHNIRPNEENLFLPVLVDKNVCNYEVNKINVAVKFLLSPEIKEISADQMKAKFLKSKGFSEDDIKEVFHRLYSINNGINVTSPSILLNAVAGDVKSDNKTTLVPRNKTQMSSLSLFFNLCRKLIVFICISSSCYYMYQKWLYLRTKMDKRKKDERDIQNELNHIKNELTKITVELRRYQSLERHQTNLLTEINSLKAILVSKQYFEEKQTTKLTIPSWQLNNSSKSKAKNTATSDIPSSEFTVAKNDTHSVDLSVSETTGVLNKTDIKSDQTSIDSCTPPVNLNEINVTRTAVSLLTEENDLIPAHQCHGSKDTLNSKKTCDIENGKQSRDQLGLLSSEKKEMKTENDKKHNSGNSIDKNKKSVRKNC